MYYVLLLAASGRFPSPIKNVNPVKVGNNSKLRFPTRRVAGTAQRPCDGHSPVCVCRKLQGLPSDLVPRWRGTFPGFVFAQCTAPWFGCAPFAVGVLEPHSGRGLYQGVSARLGWC